MKYAPEARSSHESADLSQTLLKSLNPSESTIKKQFNSLRGSSGKTYGELEMPEAAPLVFPELDALAASNETDGKKKSSLKKKGAFIATYMDKRAQASYVSITRASIYSLTTSTNPTVSASCPKTPTRPSPPRIPSNPNLPPATATPVLLYTAAPSSRSSQAAESKLLHGIVERVVWAKGHLV